MSSDRHRAHQAPLLMPEYEPLTGLDEANPLAASLIDLEQIPSRLWEQAMSPLHRQQRALIARRIKDERLREIASKLAFEMDMAECDRSIARDEAHHRARRTAAPLPSADADHAAVRASVQVNLRLRADDHGRLVQAAASAGMRPTTLARALVLNGVAKIRADHERRETP